MGRGVIKYTGSALFVLTGLMVIILQPIPEGLDSTGQLMLGAVLITLAIWIFKPFDLPFSMGAIFLALFSLAAGLKPVDVFSGFTQTAIWTLIPALFFGFVLQKTGLGRRIAFGVIKLFKPSYLGLVLAWVVIGILLSILTPSITVRVAIVMPIAMQCCELCKLEPGSKGNSLILLTAFSMALIPGAGWLTGSLWGPILQGMFDAVPEMEGLVSFDSWFSVLFVPMEIVAAILVVGGYILLKPKEKIPEDAIDSIRKEKADRISREEIITAVILSLVFILFLTNRLHGMPDAVVCLGAVFLLFLFGVLEAKDIGTGVSWDLVIFLAMALSLSALFKVTGISDWLAGIVVPALAPLAASPWLFVLAIIVILFAWRFVDAALLMPTIAILAPLLPVIASTYNVDPLVWLCLFVMAGNAFFMVYQNMFAVVGQSVTKERPWTAGHLGMYGSLYFVACLIALLVAIPLWISAGYLG